MCSHVQTSNGYIIVSESRTITVEGKKGFILTTQVPPKVGQKFITEGEETFIIASVQKHDEGYLILPK